MKTNNTTSKIRFGLRIQVIERYARQKNGSVSLFLIFILTYGETWEERRKPVAFTLHLNIELQIITIHSSGEFPLTCNIKKSNCTNINDFVTCMKHCLNFLALFNSPLRKLICSLFYKLKIPLQNYICKVIVIFYLMIYFYWTIPQLAHNFSLCEF